VVSHLEIMQKYNQNHRRRRRPSNGPINWLLGVGIIPSRYGTSNDRIISTINGQRVVICLDTSYHTSGIVVTGHPDCTIRLWDTRTSPTKDASSTVSDTTFRPSHAEWVSGVKWSPTNPHQIVLTSYSEYDGTMKLWDICTSLPVYTVQTLPNKEKGLSVSYYRWKNDSTGTRNNTHDSNDDIQYVLLVVQIV
jgi:WD40 repeat protein